MSPIPNIISASRVIASLTMLFVSVFSSGFWVLYCWCGISDMIDGTLARKLGAVSELGSRIDSLADLVFFICSAVLILPSLDLPVWIWLWIAIIGLIKIVGIIINSSRRRKIMIPHSLFNRFTGILIFLLAFAITHCEALIPAIIVCTSATVSLFEDFQYIFRPVLRTEQA